MLKKCVQIHAHVSISSNFYIEINSACPRLKKLQNSNTRRIINVKRFRIDAHKLSKNLNKRLHKQALELDVKVPRSALETNQREDKRLHGP